MHTAQISDKYDGSRAWSSCATEEDAGAVTGARCTSRGVGEVPGAALELRDQSSMIVDRFPVATKLGFDDAGSAGGA